MNKHSFSIILLAIIIIAGAFRFIHLELRPMHTDEAVHGIKFGQLLEEGMYQYDKVDYHGPTLNYLTLIPAFLQGQEKITDVDQFTLRSVTALTGLLLLLFLFWLRKFVSLAEMIILFILLAIAPLLVFYSRYYIQEILLVTFNFGFLIACVRYISGKRVAWLIAAAVLAGLTMATKETWLMFFGLQAMALIFTLLHIKKPGQSWYQFMSFFKSAHLLIAAIVIVFIYLLFYSSFFTHLQGIIESFEAFTGYFQKASNQAVHGQPWWYYGEVLIKPTEGYFPRADLWIFIGGTIGAVLVFSKKPKDTRQSFYLFIAYSTFLSLGLLSVFSYKTPWNILVPYTGLIFLSGYTLQWLYLKSKFPLAFMVPPLLIVHLGWQTWQDNFVHYTDPENTLVYSHPTEDLFDLSEKIHQVFDSLSEEENFYLQVIYPGHDYWPLPWYLRDLRNISWLSAVDFDGPVAPFIISHLPNPDLTKKLYELPPPGQRLLYIPLFEEPRQLRPGAPVNAFLRKDLWEEFNR